MISRLCRGKLLVSSQTAPLDGLLAENRSSRLTERELGELSGYEPTEELFLEMIAHAGFRDPQLVSTAPHPGEAPGIVCGNRSYFIADSAIKPRPLPFTRDWSKSRP